MRFFRVSYSYIFATIVLLATGILRAEAATFQVTSTADSGVGSLRQAITDANAAAGSDTITFALPAGAHSIDLTTVGDDRSGDRSAFELTGSVSIVGPGADLLTVRRSMAAGTPDFRLFRVSGAASISGLTLSNGQCSLNATTNTAYSGGGFFNTGNLNMTNCVVSGNSSSVVFLNEGVQSGGTGGGIYNNGILNLTQCLVADNETSTAGGGLFNYGGTATVSSCTFSGNECRAPERTTGGGLANAGRLSMSNSTFYGNRSIESPVATHASVHEGGGLYNGNQGIATLDSCTFSANSTFGSGMALGGGIVSFGAAPLGLNNSIVAGNIAKSTHGGSFAFDVYGDLTGDYNLVRDANQVSLSGQHNTIGLDPLLGPLQNNGGKTPTMEPQAGSPALDAGNTALTSDQRGVARPQGDAADIGAVETDATKPLVGFLTPAEGGTLAISAFNSTTISGIARDSAGVSAVRFTLSRSRNGATQFWNGTSFTATSLALPATLSGSGARVKWGLGNLTPPTGQLDAGAYQVNAIAFDGNGNRIGAAALTFKLASVGEDSSVPVVSIASPTVAQKILLSSFSGSSISGSATDDTGVSTVKVQLSRKRGGVNFYWNGYEFDRTIVTVDVPVKGTISATWSLGSQRPAASLLDAGAYQVVAQAIDLVGNASAKVTVPFTLGTDFTAPSVSISSPTQNQAIAFSALGTIQGAASDNLGVTAVAMKLQRVRNGAKSYWDGRQFVATPFTFAAKLSVVGGTNVTWATPKFSSYDLDAGAYTVYATAYDEAGNATTSPSRLFTIISAQPAGVSVSGGGS